MMTADEVSALPIVRALRPIATPHLTSLSGHSDLVVWHVDVEFEEWAIPPALAARWSDKESSVADTWQKRPLAAGIDSGCIYSCGEVEIAARLRNAGFESYWISEWSGFPHVEAWEPFCIKRSEFSARAPDLWQYDQDLRTDPRNASRGLGRSGGHPDVACVTPEGNVYLEYKGPGDSIKPKQNSWATAVVEREHPRLSYLAVRGLFRPAISVGEVPPVVASESPVADRAMHSTGVEPRQQRDNSAQPPQSRPSRGSARLPPLDRRKISDTLKRERGWSIVSRVDGWIDFTPPSLGTPIDSFAREVRQAVEALGYEPTVRVARDSSGRSIVRVHTPETLEQAPRGAHGV